jgi:hypothetical protein
MHELEAPIYIYNMRIVVNQDQIPQINNSNVMSGITILFAYMTHYLFQILLLLKSETEKFKNFMALSRKMVLFGVAAIISSSMLQYSAFMAIMAWLSLVMVITLHCFVLLNEVPNRYRAWAFFFYYLSLVVWYAGIIVIFLLDAFS